MDRALKVVGLSSVLLGTAVFALLVAEIISANLLVAEHLDADAAISHWQITTTTGLKIFNEHVSNLQFSKLAAVKGLIWVFAEKTYYVALLLIAIVGYYWLRLAVLRPPLLSSQPKISPADHAEQVTNNTQVELEKLYNSPAYKKYLKDKMEGKFDNADDTDDEVVLQIREKLGC